MTLFLSTYVNKIDRKGRVSVPAPFRQALAGQSFPGIYVFRSMQYPALECFSAQQMEMLSDSLDDPDLPADQRDLLETIIFGGTAQLPFDPEGRIIIPQDFMEFAGLAEEAAFLGLRKTFQIWEPKALAAHTEAQRQAARSKNISLSTVIATSGRARARPPGGGTP